MWSGRNLFHHKAYEFWEHSPHAWPCENFADEPAWLVHVTVLAQEFPYLRFPHFHKQFVQFFVAEPVEIFSQLPVQLQLFVDWLQVLGVIG